MKMKRKNSNLIHQHDEKKKRKEEKNFKKLTKKVEKDFFIWN
jgi:hypothetical protein